MHANQQLTVRDIMSRDVKTVSPETLLRDVALLLATHHISGAPVVDAAGRVVGVISESDLINEHKRRGAIPAQAVFGVYPVHEGLLQHAYEGGMACPVRSVMSHRVTTALPDTPLTELADLMVADDINRVPIVEEDGRLVGIVARADILRTLVAARSEQPA